MLLEGEELNGLHLRLLDAGDDLELPTTARTALDLHTNQGNLAQRLLIISVLGAGGVTASPMRLALLRSIALRDRSPIWSLDQGCCG
jgi:hypothetical protein